MRPALPHYQDDIADSYGPRLGELTNARAGYPPSFTHIRHYGPVVARGPVVNVFRCGVCGASHERLPWRAPDIGAAPGVTAHATCPRTGITLDLSIRF